VLFIKGEKMSKKARPKTHVAIVLDSSGSMATTKLQTVQGFNEQVQQAKANAKDQDIDVCLVTFNGEVFEHQWLVPVEELQEACLDDYQPMGSTAMRDAIGYTISKLLETTDINDTNAAYLIYVVSDGQENVSKHYSTSALRELVESVEKRPNWNIVYMGCDKKYLEEVAAQTGIPISNMAAWSNAVPGTAAGGWSASNKRIDEKFYRMRSAGLNKCDNIYTENIGLCADFSNEVAPTITAPPDLNVTHTAKTNVFGSNTPVNWTK
jgi:uncharacterized protein YegL